MCSSDLHVMALLALEGGLVTLLGVLAGWGVSVLGIALAAPWAQREFGIALQLAAPTAAQWALMAAVLAAGMLASLVPGWRAYRLSLADGLSPR